MELHRDSLGEDYIPKRSSSSNKASLKAASPMSTATLTQTYGHPSSPVLHDFGAEKGTTKKTTGYKTGILAEMQNNWFHYSLIYISF